MKDILIGILILVVGFQFGKNFNSDSSEPDNVLDSEKTECVINFDNVMWPEYRNLSSIVIDEANRQRINPTVIFAVIKHESVWDPNAVSPAGAIGLMQIMPATGKSFCGLSEKELYNPKKNVRCGISYLVMLGKKFRGDLKLALCGYNAGPHRVMTLGGCPNFKETNKYTRNILKVLGKPKLIKIKGGNNG